MRKLKVSGILLICLLFVLPVNTRAEGTVSYELDELKLSIEIPGELLTVTRDTLAEDPVYAQLGVTKRDLDSFFEAENIYLDAMGPEMDYEIYITCVEQEGDLCTWSNTALNVLAATLADGYENSEYTFIKSEIYTHAQEKFLKIYLSREQEGMTIYTIRYATFCDDKIINVMLNAFTGHLSEEYEEKLKNIVESISFWNKEKLEKPLEYTDPVSGLQFTIPYGWKEVPLSEERKMICAKFVPGSQNGFCILYGALDLEKLIPPEEWEGKSWEDLTGEDLDFEKWINEIFVSETAEHNRIISSKGSEVTYGRKKYSKQEIEIAVDEVNMVLPSTILVHIDGKYLYYFQGYGLGKEFYDSDMTALLESAKYPPAVAKSVEQMESPSNTETEGFFPISHGTNVSIFAIVLGLLTATVFCCSFVFYRKRENGGRKTTLHTEQYPRTDSIPQEVSYQRVSSDSPQKPEVSKVPGKFAPPESEVAERVQFCSKCGAKLPIESKFCHKCGAKIVRGEML